MDSPQLASAVGLDHPSHNITASVDQGWALYWGTLTGDNIELVASASEKKHTAQPPAGVLQASVRWQSWPHWQCVHVNRRKHKKRAFHDSKLKCELLKCAPSEINTSSKKDSVVCAWISPSLFRAATLRRVAELVLAEHPRG